MSDFTRELMAWVDLHFGVTGQIFVCLVAIAIVFGIFRLLQKPPVPKGRPLCGYCKFKNPIKNSKVYHCHIFERRSVFKVCAPKCPYIKEKE
jgi:hypothetical protein